MNAKFAPLPVCILLTFCFNLHADNFRWTGDAGDGFWATAGNWEREVSPGDWQTAVSAPSTGAVVYLGDQTSSNAAQTITLSGDVTIDRIFMEATGNRTYTIVENSGSDPYTLTFDPGQSNYLSRTADATANFTIDVQMISVRDSSPSSITNDSETGRMVVGQGLRIDPPTSTGGMTFTSAGGGLIEFQGQVIFGSNPAGNSRWNIVPATNVLYNFDGTGNMLNRNFVIPSATGGSALFARDATFNSMWFLTSGQELNMRLFEADARDVVASYSALQGRNASPSVINVLEPLDGSSGTFTLEVRSSMVTIGDTNHAVAVNLAENTFLKLDGNMDAPNSVDRAGGVHGEGGLIKDSGGTSDIGDQNSYTGGTFIHNGTLRLISSNIPLTIGSPLFATFHGHLGPGLLHIADGATFNLNGLDQTFSGLSELDGGTGTINLNGGTLTIDSSVASEFDSANIGGAGGLVKIGGETFTLLGDYTNPAGRTLRVEAGTLAVDGDLTIQNGGFELAGGIIDLGVNDLFTVDQLWKVTLTQSTENLNLLNVVNADITDAQLSLGLADGYDPAEGTSFTLLYASNQITGASAANMFGFSDGQLVSIGSTSGGDPLWAFINWVEGSESIVLSVIPEPGSVMLILIGLGWLLGRRRLTGSGASPFGSGIAGRWMASSG